MPWERFIRKGYGYHMKKISFVKLLENIILNHLSIATSSLARQRKEFFVAHDWQ